jgi:hypothetical protein
MRLLINGINVLVKESKRSGKVGVVVGYFIDGSTATPAVMN